MLCVDETPPNDLNGTAAPWMIRPRKPFAKRAAKMALWFPFVGVLILIVLAIIVKERNGEPPIVAFTVFAVCWLIWAAGFFLGLMAWRRRKMEGPTGVSSRAIIGMMLNLLFLGATIWGAVGMADVESEMRQMRDKTAEREAEVATARVGGGAALQKELASQADQAFVADVLKLQKKYQTCKGGKRLLTSSLSPAWTCRIFTIARPTFIGRNF
jgi:hypothetical protein